MEQPRSIRPAENSLGGSIGSSSAVFALRKGQQPTPENIKNSIEQQRASGGITLGSTSVSSGTIADFCKELEKGLDRKVVDETYLTVVMTSMWSGKIAHAMSSSTC
ncbi:hypothetical protein [Granulicella mallensis]|uniref:Uncharacterized protein n=1 Tax=Granulicella mallensis TaxID=940614 RepID=A0A7W8EAF9_9BACT|nr:hypothetical protein [Granulicella mallensis]MBB5064757.1 hypothetical protein [Granulicella mallensis]